MGPTGGSSTGRLRTYSRILGELCQYERGGAILDTAETVAWVRPPEPIRGLDHLGVQAPCIALYGELLPGITNVTDRARYYAFHPWVIRSFERRYKDHSLAEFRRVLRRSECLFALIAIRHARLCGDGDEGLHGAGMVGRSELRRIGDNQALLLEDYAALDGPKRYFKNKLGGLGQYYFGPLRDLRILDRSEQGALSPPGYDRERGNALAEAFAAGVPEEAFFHAIEASSLMWEDLDQLKAFCPCYLRGNKPEHALLLDLFLARSRAYHCDDGLTRRASLALMLDLARRDAKDSEYGFEDRLRGAAYSGALADGSVWQVATALQRVQRGWGTYQRNELLSLALQGMFAALLRSIERDYGGRISQLADAASIAMKLAAPLGSKLEFPLNQVVDQARRDLPALSDWLNSNHELQRGWRLQSLQLKDDHLETIFAESIGILASLLARGVDGYPYADFNLAPEYFDPGEIHLLSFREAFHRDWATLTMGDWVKWLSIHWGVNRHIHVALRKLRAERRDTFRIRPLEGELSVVEVPEPTYTIPRVGKALQILRDLGLIDYVEGSAVLTSLGQQELEFCCVW